MGGDGEALRHRGLKSSSLGLETSKLWWGSVPLNGPGVSICARRSTRFWPSAWEAIRDSTIPFVCLLGWLDLRISPHLVAQHERFGNLLHGLAFLAALPL
jgi:hypothetical protein